jgi:hypothetical protein
MLPFRYKSPEASSPRLQHRYFITGHDKPAIHTPPTVLEVRQFALDLSSARAAFEEDAEVECVRDYFLRISQRLFECAESYWPAVCDSAFVPFLVSALLGADDVPAPILVGLLHIAINVIFHAPAQIDAFGAAGVFDVVFPLLHCGDDDVAASVVYLFADSLISDAFRERFRDRIDDFLGLFLGAEPRASLGQLIPFLSSADLRLSDAQWLQVFRGMLHLFAGRLHLLFLDSVNAYLGPESNGLRGAFYFDKFYDFPGAIAVLIDDADDAVVRKALIALGQLLLRAPNDFCLGTVPIARIIEMARRGSVEGCRVMLGCVALGHGAVVSDLSEGHFFSDVFDGKLDAMPFCRKDAVLDVCWAALRECEKTQLAAFVAGGLLGTAIENINAGDAGRVREMLSVLARARQIGRLDAIAGSFERIEEIAQEIDGEDDAASAEIGELLRLLAEMAEEVIYED